MSPGRNRRHRHYPLDLQLGFVRMVKLGMYRRLYGPNRNLKRR